MRKLKGLLSISGSLILAVVFTALIKAGVSYAATTSTYLPADSTPGSYQQIKVSADINNNEIGTTNGAVTGGDGLQPIPYRAEDGSLRIWNIYHHMDYTAPIESLPVIVCSDPTTGQACDINGDSQPDTDKYYIRSDDGDIHQPQSNFYSNTRYKEQSNGGPVVGSKLYISVDVHDQANPTMDDPNTATDEASKYDVYEYCFDMETATKCGLTKINNTSLRVDYVTNDGSAASYTTTPGNVIGDSAVGAQLINGKIYTTVADADSYTNGPTIYCFNPATSTTCGSYTVASLNIVANTTGYPARSHSDGTNIYIVSGRAGSSSSTNTDTKACVVAATLTPCAGYNKDTSGPVEDFIGRGSFMVGPNLCTLLYRGKHDATAANKLKAYSDLACYNSSGNAINSVALSTALDSIVTANNVDVSDPAYTSNYLFESPSPENYYDQESGKAYVNVYHAWTKSGETTTKTYALCVDVQTMSPCAGFANNGIIDWNQAMGKEVKSYGYNKDDQGCMWELGDSGDLISFDPNTGIIPCIKIKQEVVVDVSSSQLCEWDKVKYQTASITGLRQGYESHVNKITINIYNKSDTARANPITSFEYPPNSNFSIDLSGLNSLNPDIVAVAFIDAKDTFIWDDPTIQPKLEVVYEPSKSQSGQLLTDLKINGCRVDPTITKTNNFNPEEMAAGSTFDYEITVTNNGPSIARTLTVSDTPPSRVQIVSPISYTINGVAPANGESCAIFSGKLNCTLKNVVGTNVDANSKRVIKYKAKLMPLSTTGLLEDGNIVKNQASVATVCEDQPGHTPGSPNCDSTPAPPAESSVDPRVTDIDIKKYITNEFDQFGNPINWRDYNVKVVPGEKVAYKVVVMNNEYLTDHVSGLRIKDANGNDIKTDSAKNIQVTDKIPAGLSDISLTHNGVSGITVTPQTAALSPVDIVAKAADVASGQSFEFVTKATYIGESPNTEFVNFVQHTKTTCKNSDGTTVDCNSDGDSKPGNCNLQSPKQEDDCATRGISQEKIYDLETMKSADNKLPLNKVGEQIEYTVKVVNNGPADSPADLSFSDALPAEVEYVSNEVVSGMKDCAFADGKISCKLLAIKPGEANAATIKIKVKLNSKIKGESFKNAAEVECIKAPSIDSAEQGEVNCDNNKDDEDVDPRLADLSLVKKIRLSNNQLVDVSDSQAVGSNVTYVVQLTNSGPDAATNVKVKEQLPDGLEYVSAAPEYGSFDAATMTWSLPEIASGVTQNLIITAIYKGGNNVKNVAEVVASDVPDTDSTPNNCSSTEEDDCDSASILTPGKGTGIGVPVTGALVGKIIAGATGISLAAYLGRDLVLRRQKKTNSER